MNPNPTYYKRTDIGRNRTAFMFDDLGTYNRFITDVEAVATGNAKDGLDRLNRPNYIESNARVSWYGTDDPQKVKGNLDTYLFNNDLDSFLNTLKGKTINIDVIDLDQQKSIKFTEIPIGIFSFDLASLGLIRVYEYFSPLLNRIVDSNFVKSKKLPNKQLIFYHVYIPYVPQHKVTYNASKGGFYSSILDLVIPKSKLIEVDDGRDIYMAYPERQEIPEHELVRQQKKDKKGRLMFSSTWKKSFVYIPKVEKSLPRIDLIISSSFNAGIKADTQMIYSSMAAIAVAEKLSKSGVNYRILACYPVETSGGVRKYEVYPFVTIKKEGEPLDKNKMALLTSDGRQFRYQQFKAFLATQFDAGYNTSIDPNGIGRAIYEDDKIKRAYIDYLSAQTNVEDQQAALNTKSKIVFSGALSMQQAVDQYNRIITEISKV